jgi:hypothetical protein
MPFFGFSQSSSFMNVDMSWRWMAPVIADTPLYNKMPQSQNHSDKFYETLARQTLWEDREPKAAFYDSLSSIRQIFFDKVLQHPDLFDAHWRENGAGSLPWNPNSVENRGENSDERDVNYQQHNATTHTSLQYGFTSTTAFNRPQLPTMEVRILPSFKCSWWLCACGSPGNISIPFRRCSVIIFHPD